MSKRYYLAALIGDGTESSPYRPAVAEHGVTWSGSIPIDLAEASATYGQPLHGDCLCIVSAPDHSALLADVRLYALPDIALETEMPGVDAAVRQALAASLNARGIVLAGLEAGTYRDVLQSIGAQRDPDFNLAAFDVGA